MSNNQNISGNSIGDMHTYMRYYTENLMKIGWLGIKNNPIKMISEISKIPWMRQLLKANHLMEIMVKGRKGLYREANAVVVANVITSIVEMVDGIYSKPEKTVLHEDLIPPEILFGMGLNPWMAEFLGIVVPFIDTATIESYIDEAENYGIPPDVCSLPKSTMGLVLREEMPKPIAIVSSNMPCDGGMTSYTLIQKKLNVPLFMLDIPYNFYDEHAIEYFVGELKRLIAFLEEHTPCKMDWDRMREVCECRNKRVELEHELWDMIRARPAPMAGEPIYLTHLMWGIAHPGQPRGVKTLEKVIEITKKVLESGQGVVPDEKYRVALWNPPTLIYPELFTWAEKKWGVAMLMDMLTFNRHPFIDTTSKETMLRDLAIIMMQGPMARHTRGPSENFFNDLFYLHEQFSIDMIWMAAHIGCKNTQALLGIFREKCRDREIPLHIINYDLSDTRIVSPANIRKQTEEFMDIVMNAERLDGTSNGNIL